MTVRVSNMGENERLLISSANYGLSDDCKEAFHQLQEHINNNTSSFCCRQIRLISHAQNVTIKEQWIYIASLYTLVERRWSTKRIRPYTDNEICPNNPAGDIWQDYEFDPPKTTILNPPQLSIKQNLDQTRHRQGCSSCQSNEQIECSQCKNQRSIVTWIELNVKWLNISSSLLFSSNEQLLCPQSIIQTATNKTKCFEFDDIWPANQETLDHILDTCRDLPAKFRDELNSKFLTHQKADKILRLKCIIERLRIQQITYQFNKLQNEVFTFHLLGENKKLYINEHSYPSHIQQSKTACSLL